MAGVKIAVLPVFISTLDVGHCPFTMDVETRHLRSFLCFVSALKNRVMTDSGKALFLRRTFGGSISYQIVRGYVI
jgi:hypothetical protein